MSEHDWIDRHIRPLVTAAGAASLQDDVAELDSHGRQIATMDTLVEGVHFLLGDPVRTVGRKLIRVNVSDIIAKGAKPHEALLSIAWPTRLDEVAFKAFMQGVARGLATYQISLVGGDLVKTPGPMTVTLTLTGLCGPNGPVRRVGGIVAGDRLLISGEIGWGILGLEAARAGAASKAVENFRVPQLPPLGISQTVAQYAKASTDISDGLLLDAKRLIDANKKGAVLDLASVPLARPSGDLTGVMKQVTGGDDYQILIVASAGVQIEGFTNIGYIRDERRFDLNWNGSRINLPERLGFEH